MKTSIAKFFSDTVSRHPEKIAVIDDQGSRTFSELHASVEGLSAMISALELPTNVVIAVYLRKSYQAVVADLAVTAAGCVYMNLDVKSPPARLEGIVSIIQPRLFITDEHGITVLKSIAPVGVPILDVASRGSSVATDLGRAAMQVRVDSIIDTDPYCIINTSGSTGIPKGVVLNHKGFIDFVEWSAFDLGVDGSEVVGSLSPVIFDIFSYELCMLACKGSTLCLINDQLTPFPGRILEYISQHRVSFIFWVPTIMVNIANMGLLEKFPLPDLRTIWFAGEVFPTIHFNRWFDKLAGRMFVNLYGPIEITLDCTFHIVKERVPDDQSIPMGIPCRNMSVLVLDEHGRPVKDGEVGELYVRGTGLAMGYYNNPAQTSKAFVQNPLNSSYPETIYRTGDLVVREGGLLYFRGRADTMVKHMGYRIELAEIEHAILASVAEVRNVCVVYRAEAKEIVAYCEYSAQLDDGEFRRRLASRLPKYMIPGRIVPVSAMPMNANGKIDRLYFKNLDGKHPGT